MQRKTLIGVGILLLAVCAGAAVISFAMRSNAAQVITISTTPVAHLTPHQHGSTDAVHDHHHGVQIVSPYYVTEEDLWITGIEFVLENADMVTLHHAGLGDLNAYHQMCPGNPAYPRELYSITPDMAERPVVFPEGHGLFVRKGTPLALDVMLHNPAPPYGPGISYEQVVASVRLTVEPAATVEKKKVEYYRLHLADSSCPGGPNEEVFNVPPHSEAYVKHGGGFAAEEPDPSSLTFDTSGEIIHMISHLHPWEGGLQLDAYLNDELFATFVPEQTGPERWEWITPHLLPEGLRVKAGDTLSITATYENPYDFATRGAMGMLAIYLAPNR